MPLFTRSTLALFVLALLAPVGCNDAKELVDLGLDPPERKPIDVGRTGVTDFFVDREFGTVEQQYAEIRDKLGLRHVRVLFAWTDAVQPTPSSPVNVGFFDQIISSAPPGVDILVTVAHTPSWMADRANWVTGDPRSTWIELWFKPLVQRYGSAGQITGWEIWNEPDLTVVPSDAALGLTYPVGYYQLAKLGAQVVRTYAPGKLVVMAATQSIQQNFPVAFNYNKTLKELGIQDVIDVWNIHYYGTRFESVVSSGGVADFLNGVGKPIWVTESGEQGPNNQLAYVETTWPFLREEIPGIDRFYYFEYGSSAAIDQNYGLRTTDPSFPVSDLYVDLRDKAGG